MIRNARNQFFITDPFIVDTTAEMDLVLPTTIEGVQCLNKENNKYYVKIGNSWIELTGSGGGSAWGGITGTLANQADLQSALDAKSNTHTHPYASDVHGHTKADVGLGNADNTSDVNKPVSTATQSALDGKLDDAQFSGLAKITVSITQPSSPSLGDLWVDTN